MSTPDEFDLEIERFYKRVQGCVITEHTIPDWVIEILKSQLAERIMELETKILKLDALEQAGVDNWSGYSEAMDLFREMKLPQPPRESDEFAE